MSKTGARMRMSQRKKRQAARNRFGVVPPTVSPKALERINAEKRRRTGKRGKKIISVKNALNFADLKKRAGKAGVLVEPAGDLIILSLSDGNRRFVINPKTDPKSILKQIKHIVNLQEKNRFTRNKK